MNSDAFRNKIARAIDKKYKEKFKTKIEFAAAANLDERTIRRILKEEHSVTAQSLKQICDSLDIKMSELLAEIGE